MPSLTENLDSRLERIFGYHGPYTRPHAIQGRIWAAPANIPTGPTQPAKYFLHYFQSQGYGPTAAVMSMNIAADLIASKGKKPLPYSSDIRLEDYISTLDAGGIAAWKYRYSTKSPLPGMMSPWQAIRALKQHAAGLKTKYNRGYTIQLSPGRTVDDLVRTLQERKIVLIHGAWKIKLTDPVNRNLALIGGMPHTMVLTGYDAAADRWMLLNPADPWWTQRPAKPPADLFKMTTKELLEFWGRRFVFYPPRFSTTTIALDS